MRRLWLLLLAVTGSAFAQESMKDDTYYEAYVELLRSDLNAEKVAIITEVMQFTDEQSNAFWPIYREYETEMAALGDQRLGIIRDYGEHYESMTDAKAKELIDRSFKLDDSRLKTDKKYWKKFEKVLPSTVAARFMQVNNQMNFFSVRLQIATELPLVPDAVAEMESAER